MNRLKKWSAIAVMLNTLLLSANSLAASTHTGDSIKYVFKGILNGATKCSISNDQVIDIPFGDVGASKIVAGIYINAIPYTFFCNGSGANSTVLMAIKGTPVAASNSTVASNRKGLWVTFLKDGQPLKLNERFTVADPLNPPRLEVQLTKDPNADFEGGTFKVTVTLLAEYI